MKLLELVTEVLRGSALAIVGGWLFAFLTFVIAAVRVGNSSAPEVLFGAALMAGLAVYVVGWIVLGTGGLLGLLVVTWAAKTCSSRRAFARGALLGAVFGAVVVASGSYLGGGRDITEAMTHANLYTLILVAALFTALGVGSYSQLRWRGLCLSVAPPQESG